MAMTMGSLNLGTLMGLHDDLTQYFWFESNSSATYGAGVHITLSPESSFIASPSGQNILINTDGISIRNALLPMMVLDNDSLDFNTVDIVNGTYTNVASFGAVSTIGVDTGVNVLINENGMKVRDGETEKASFGVMSRIGEENKSRVEITNDRFRQVTDSEVAAIDIQSSGTMGTEEVEYIYQNNEYFTFSRVPANGTLEKPIYDYTFDDPTTASPVVFKVADAIGTEYNIVSQSITYNANSDTEVTIYSNKTFDSYSGKIKYAAKLKWTTDGKLTLILVFTNTDSIAIPTMVTRRSIYIDGFTYNKLVEIPSIELNGAITFKRPADVFIVESHTTGTLTDTSSHNAFANQTLAISKTGYYPVGIVGFDENGTLSSYLHVYGMYLSNQTVGSGTVNYSRRVTGYSGSNTLSATIAFYVLWVKAT